MDANRRAVLHAAGGLALAWPCLRALAASADAVFDAKDAATVLAAVAADAAPTSALALEIDDHIEGASSVPVALVSSLEGTTELHLVVDGNPWPYIAAVRLTPAVAPMVGLRIRVAESSLVRAVALTPDRRVHVASKRVNVNGGGCSTADADDDADRALEAKPMRIRGRLRPDGRADVTVLLEHPMENGLRTTRSGRPIPARYVRRLVADVNGNPVLDLRFGRSVATNPQVSFRLAAASANDVLTLAWEDTQGAKRTDSARVAA